MPSLRNYDECAGHLGHEARLVRNEEDVQTLFGELKGVRETLHKIDKRTTAMWAKMGGVFLGAGSILGVVWKVIDKVSLQDMVR